MLDDDGVTGCQRLSDPIHLFGDTFWAMLLFDDTSTSGLSSYVRGLSRPPKSSSSNHSPTLKRINNRLIRPCKMMVRLDIARQLRIKTTVLWTRIVGFRVQPCLRSTRVTRTGSNGEAAMQRRVPARGDPVDVTGTEKKRKKRKESLLVPSRRVYAREGRGNQNAGWPPLRR